MLVVRTRFRRDDLTRYSCDRIDRLFSAILAYLGSALCSAGIALASDGVNREASQ
ncbi:MAG: hypothetical protein QOF56_1712 [Acidobacteriaceae bacterium]|jgi:hypothetical protein|nr:hypothetical protein [Acidobacteriaceae bacterium]